MNIQIDQHTLELAKVLDANTEEIEYNIEAGIRIASKRDPFGQSQSS